jgi:hypothetical protein
MVYLWKDLYFEIHDTLVISHFIHCETLLVHMDKMVAHGSWAGSSFFSDSRFDSIFILLQCSGLELRHGFCAEITGILCFLSATKQAFDCIRGGSIEIPNVKLSN